MTIKKWHYGKIVLLWIWALFIVYFCFFELGEIGKNKNLFLLKMVFSSLIIGLPLVLSIITWKWLSGKDSNKK
jgi:hypothetical protein